MYSFFNRQIVPFLLFLVSFTAAAQVDCNSLNINSVKGQWVWQKGGYGRQWAYCEPIRKEMQRIMPVSLNGLQATNGIAFGNTPAVPNTAAAPKYYECYLMLKKYECLKGYNKIQPEGETGCWAYFIINSILPEGAAFLSRQPFGYYLNEGGIYTGDFSIEQDASGNRVLYVSDFNTHNEKVGLYFSAKDRLPVRKISWKELILSYKSKSEKELNGKISYAKESLQKSQQNLTTTKFDDTRQYLTQLIADRKKEITKLEEELAGLGTWFAKLQSHPEINEPARVGIRYLDKAEIELQLNSKEEEGRFPLWIEDIGFYDLKLPKDQPQTVLFRYRRQDNELPKKQFMDLFVSTFNLDVVAGMAGEVVKKRNGVNTTAASLNEAKAATVASSMANVVYRDELDKASLNQFPAGWKGMNNITVKSFENKNRLAMDKDGYWYPRQYNQEVKDKFQLGFNLRWNKDIAYNSGLFTVSFCSMDFDNAAGNYTTGTGNSMSFYDGYTGNFNRVVCWFDPHANSGGQLTIYSYARNESVVTSKKVNLPDFYLTRNNHQLRFERKGNDLLVFINDKQAALAANAFISGVRYNLYTFSRYKGNNSDNKNDVFYLSDLEANW